MIQSHIYKSVIRLQTNKNVDIKWGEHEEFLYSNRYQTLKVNNLHV